MPGTIAIVGRPNVGKSSMVNALTGQERNIVTDISGTTRDSIHTRYKAFGFDFLLIDTAGIRKKAKVTEDIEYYSVLRSVRTIENADVCMFMIDAAEGIQKQDLSIFYMCEKNSKGVVVLVNKWDLVEKGQEDQLLFFVSYSLFPLAVEATKKRRSKEEQIKSSLTHIRTDGKQMILELEKETKQTA